MVLFDLSKLIPNLSITSLLKSGPGVILSVSKMVKDEVALTLPLSSFNCIFEPPTLTLPVIFPLKTVFPYIENP